MAEGGGQTGFLGRDGVRGRDMADHDHRHPGFDARGKRLEFAAAHLVQCAGGGSDAEVAVLGRVAMAGEVFEAAEHAGLVKAFDRRPHAGCGFVRVGREGARADDRVVRVGVDVGIRGEVEVEAVVLEITADRNAHIAHGVGPLRADSGRAFVLRQAERFDLGQAGNRAALLIDADEHRHAGGAAEFGRKIADLFFVAQVFAKQNNAADRVPRQRLLHRGGQLGDAVGIGVVELLLGDAQIERVGADQKQLADLFLQRERIDRPGVVRLRGRLFCRCRVGFRRRGGFFRRRGLRGGRLGRQLLRSRRGGGLGRFDRSGGRTGGQHGGGQAQGGQAAKQRMFHAGSFLIECSEFSVQMWWTRGLRPREFLTQAPPLSGHYTMKAGK